MSAVRNLFFVQPSFWAGAARAFDLFGLADDCDNPTLDTQVTWKSDWDVSRNDTMVDEVRAWMSIAWNLDRDALGDDWKIILGDPMKASEVTEPGPAIRV